MSDLPEVPPEVQRSRPIVSLVILFVLGAINVFLLLFIVPRFEQIYVDSLPGMPLPIMTWFLLAFRVPLACLAVAWPLAGIVVVWMRHRYTGWVVILGFWFFLAMIPVALFALFDPMTLSLTSMSDTSSMTKPASDH